MRKCGELGDRTDDDNDDLGDAEAAGSKGRRR